MAVARQKWCGGEGEEPEVGFKQNEEEMECAGQAEKSLKSPPEDTCPLLWVLVYVC